MLKKCGIVTLYDNINIGNKLQNYAVRKIMLKYSEKVYTFTYKEAKNIYSEMSWKGKIVAFLGIPRSKAQLRRKQLKRRRKFEEFSDRYLNPLPEKKFKNYQNKYYSAYDVVVVGSDQVWHNWTNTEDEMDYFFLNFVDKYRRLALAPSFGFDDVPERFAEQYKNGINGFEYLSCREISGADIIKGITEKECEVLVDPTMVLTKTEWIEISTMPKYDVPEHFLLVYFLGGMNDKQRERCSEIAEKMKLRIIDIMDITESEYYCTSPSEFIYMINNADFVFTNSFHGTVFSLIFNKAFEVADRNDNEGSGMNNRIVTVLKKFNLRNDTANIDFDYVNNVLDIERDKVLKYIEKCINNIVES